MSAHCRTTQSTLCFLFFFFNDTATTEIYTLSLHDALPIYFFDGEDIGFGQVFDVREAHVILTRADHARLALLEGRQERSEEHTSELQSRLHLVCRLLLEKKKKNRKRKKQSYKLPSGRRCAA